MMKTAALLLPLAALSAAAAASPAQSPAKSSAPSSASGRSSLDFRTADWLTALDVHDDSGEEIAEVSDLIIDRGTGRITHLVVSTGSTLGLGGKDIAVPYGSFSWDPAKERLVLSSTAEQLQSFPEYSAKNWSAMMESTETQNDLRKALTSDTRVSSDPYATSLENASTQRFDGVIRSVERVETDRFGEQIVVTVEREKGDLRPVALGPNWFVGGGSYVPMRGDEVEVTALELPRDPQKLSVAIEIESNDRSLKLRDDSGRPLWSVKSIPVGGREYGAPYWQYMLASSMDGADVNCRGARCGDVEALIFERGSGIVAFLSIDPDENFLGIADTSRLIPWAVVSIAHDGAVRIDASKEMVLASQPTPDDMKGFASSGLPDRVHAAFDVRAPKFAPVRGESPRGLAAGDAWAADGVVLGSIDRSNARTLSGKVIAASDLALGEGMKPARALSIDTGSSREVVLLGPSWFMANQKPTCDPGDRLTAEVVRTQVNGKDYWLARSYELDGTRVVILDGSDRPSWDRR